MTDEHTKGTSTKAKGEIEETAGKVTGNKEQEAHGQVKQVEGEAQKAAADIQDAVQNPRG